MMNTLYIRSIKRAEGAREDSYIFELPVVQHLHQLDFTKRVTFFVGENGTGKSTLLEALAIGCGFNAEGGTKNFHFATSETHSPLYQFLNIVKGAIKPKDGFFLRAESFYNVATEIDRLNEIPSFGSQRSLLDSYGGRSLHNQSHGESFLALALNRFGGNGLYILDEPEAALSPSRQMTLLVRMHELVSQNSQLIIATHSPILLAYPDADIYVLHEGGITLTPYRQTDHYRLTKQFLDDPERMLKYLLED